MRLPSPEYRRLARSILALEGGDDPESDALLRATERAFGRLFTHLAGVIGVTGSLTLCARAVRLVRTEFPFLDPVQLGTTPEDHRRALGEALHTVAPEQARHGVTALLASCLESLASFIGDDLVSILVREIWPDLYTVHEQPGRGGILDD